MEPRSDLVPASGQLQHVQHLDEDHASGAGRPHGHDLVVPVTAPDRRPDPGDVVGQVFPRHEPAMSLHVPLDQLGDLAQIEGPGAVPGNGLQRARQVGLSEGPAGRRRTSARQKDAAGLIESLQEGSGRFQRSGEVLFHHEAISGQIDGRLQQPAPGKRSETAPGQMESGHGPRNSRSQVPDGGQLRNHLSRSVQIHVAAGASGGHLAIVHADLPAGLGIVIEEETPAPQVAGDGVHHGEREAHGNGGVDGVPALSHDVDPGLAGQRVGADHHPPGSDGGARSRHLGTAGEETRGDEKKPKPEEPPVFSGSPGQPGFSSRSVDCTHQVIPVRQEGVQESVGMSFGRQVA